MSENTPAGITASRKKREITINWEDEHVSVYPFSLVRHACPCAECRGGHEHMSSNPPPGVFDLPDVDTPATRMQKLEAVGSYAIMIEWEDGHHYGIYNWHYLRALCPCPSCRSG